MSRTVRRFPRWVAAAAVVFLVVGVYAWPLWTGATYDAAGLVPSRRVDFPPSYLDAAAWLDEQNGSFSVLQIPYSTTNNLISYLWQNGTSGFLGISPLQALSHRSIVLGPGAPAQLVGLLVNRTLTDCAYLSFLNVRYVVVSTDANWPWIENQSTYLFPARDEVSTWLSGFTNCRLATTFGPVLIYQNLAWTPSLVRVSQSLQGFVSDRPPISLDFWNQSLSPAQDKVSPDHYSATVTTATPSVVYLNLAFDSHWELRVNGVPQPESAHFVAYSYMNAWRVDAAGRLSLDFVYTEAVLELGASVSLGSFATIFLLTLWNNPELLRRAKRLAWLFRIQRR